MGTPGALFKIYKWKWRRLVDVIKIYLSKAENSLF
jgi:hypothetical protein